MYALAEQPLIEQDFYVEKGEDYFKLRHQFPDLDDVLFLRQFKEQGEHPEWALDEARQNIAGRIGEGEVPRLVKPVMQHWDEAAQAFISYGDSTIRHALVGLNLLDFADPRNQDEIRRRQAFVRDEQRNHNPAVMTTMAEGKQRITISCRVEPHEVPDIEHVRRSFGYDERTMVFAQTLTPDLQTKILTPIQVFGVPNIYIAKCVEAQFGMRASSHGATLLEQMSADDFFIPAENPYDIIDWFFESLLAVIDDEEIMQSVLAQYEEIKQQQAYLHAMVNEKTEELLQFCQVVEASIEKGYATQEVERFVSTLQSYLHEDVRQKLADNTRGGKLHMTFEVAEIIMRLKKNPLMLRAGVLAGNQTTIDKVGVQTSRHIMDLELQRQVSDQQLLDGATTVDVVAASSNAASGGGCSGSISGLFGGAGDGTMAREGENDKAAKSEVMRCVTCPLCGREGVDATITYTKKDKTITCSKCKGSKTYKND